MTSEPQRRRSVIELLTAANQLRPDHPAYIYLEDGTREAGRLSFAELHGRACALAHELERRSLRGRCALLVFPAGLDFIVSFYACIYAGVIAVPAPAPRALSGAESHRRMQLLHGDANARAVLTTPELSAACREALADELTPSSLIEVDWSTLPSTPFVPRDVDPDEVAYLQYTSGSTRAPKGVMITHGNVVSNLTGIAYAFHSTESDLNVTWLPHFHDMGLLDGVLHSAFARHTTVLMSPQAFLKRPLRWLEAISRFRATRTGGPTFAYRDCVRARAGARLDALDLQSWRVAYCGAEPIRAEALEQFADAFAHAGFRRSAILPAYGLAEATLCVSVGGLGESVQTVPAPAHEGAAAKGARVVLCGRPVLGAELAIVDPTSGERCAAGNVGEVWVSGAGVSPGYWNLPAESSCFDARLRGSESRFLRTGDLGFVVNGQLAIAGRLKDMMIMDGRNVFPEDVEHTVFGANLALHAARCAAFSVEHAESERLILVVGLPARAASELDLTQLAARVRSEVARAHGLTVRDLVFVKLSAVPLTSSGKVQRRACKLRYLERSLSPLTPRSASASNAGE
jgi:acyl-CoA synthetase (AMP-forming)/AMP-acid ligase II